MADDLDLNRIKPPGSTPPDEQDSKTQAETQEFRKAPSKLSPTDRLSISHQSHLDDQKSQIERLCHELTMIQSECREVLRRGDGLASRCSALEERNRATGRIAIVSNVFEGTGGFFLALAGAGMTEDAVSKASLLVGGIICIITGIVVGVAARWDGTDNLPAVDVLPPPPTQPYSTTIQPPHA
jgi:hypothetical protein